MNFPKIGSLFGGTAPDPKAKALQRGNIARAEVARVLAKSTPWTVRASAFSAMVSNLQVETLSFYEEDNSDTTPQAYFVSESGVAFIPVFGMLVNEPHAWWMPYFDLCSTPQLLETIAAADADVRVKDFVYVWKSPGGEAFMINAVADAMWAIRERGEKRSVSYVYEACSGAIWLASQADTIIAAADAPLGSISTVMHITDLSAYYKQLGIEIKSVTSDGGEQFKAAGYPGTELTGPQEEDLKRICNEVQALFSAGLQRGRGWTPEQTKTLADGRWYIGASGVALNLADRILTIEETLTLMATGLPMDAPMPLPDSPDTPDDDNKTDPTARRSGKGQETMTLAEVGAQLVALGNRAIGKPASAEPEAEPTTPAASTVAAAPIETGIAVLQGVAGLTDAERTELTALRDRHSTRLKAAQEKAVITATSRYGQDKDGLERAKRTIGAMTDPDAVIDLENEYKANMPRGIQQAATPTRFTQAQQVAGGHEGAADADKEARDREQLKGMVAATRGSRKPAAASASRGGNN